MYFSESLLQGTLVKRYKRFMADVTLGDGTVVTAHTANSGSMLGCSTPGAEVWISPADRADRKLKYTWELVRVNDALIGVNTIRANTLAYEAIDSGIIPELAGYETLRREVKYGAGSRVDLLLSGAPRSDCYVEVKNVTLFRSAQEDQSSSQYDALFPDAVTARGTKHLRDLSSMVKAGCRAVMLYVIQRDCEGLRHFSIASDIDPSYAAALRAAVDSGVEALCYTCTVSPAGICIVRSLPIVMP